MLFLSKRTAAKKAVTVQEFAQTLRDLNKNLGSYMGEYSLNPLFQDSGGAEKLAKINNKAMRDHLDGVMAAVEDELGKRRSGKGLSKSLVDGKGSGDELKEAAMSALHSALELKYVDASFAGKWLIRLMRANSGAESEKAYSKELELAERGKLKAPKPALDTQSS